MRLKPKYTSTGSSKGLTAKKLTKMVHDAVAVDIGWTGKAIVGGIGVLLSTITFISTITLQQVDKIDQKLFKHLTNDEIHMPTQQITPLVAFDSYKEYAAMQRSYSDAALAAMDSRLCNAINCTRTELKDDVDEVKELVRDMNYNYQKREK